MGLSTNRATDRLGIRYSMNKDVVRRILAVRYTRRKRRGGGTILAHGPGAREGQFVERQEPHHVCASDRVPPQEIRLAITVEVCNGRQLPVHIGQRPQDGRVPVIPLTNQTAFRARHRIAPQHVRSDVAVHVGPARRATRLDPLTAIRHN